MQQWKQVSIVTQPPHNVTPGVVKFFHYGAGKAVRIGRMMTMEQYHAKGGRPLSLDGCDCDQVFEIHPDDAAVLCGGERWPAQIWVCRAYLEMD